MYTVVHASTLATAVAANSACEGNESPGDNVATALQYIRNPISTLCCGQAASMASLLLAAGEKGHRQSLPNSRIMMHQPSGGYQVHDLIHSQVRTHNMVCDTGKKGIRGQI